MLSWPIKKCFVLAGVTSLLIISINFTPAFATENADNARDQAERILQNKEYGEESDRPLGEEAQRLTRWLGENNGEIKKRSDSEIREQSQPEKKPPQVTPPSLGGLSGLATILLWIFIAVIVAGIGFMIYKFWPARSKKDSSDEEDELPEDIDWSDEEKVLEFVTDAQLLENLSDKAEQEGHLDLALRYRFRAGLLRLNDLQIISFHPSITNAQWQLIIDSDSFNTITKDFNDITYGERTCDASHISRARSSWSSLITKDKTRKD